MTSPKPSEPRTGHQLYHAFPVWPGVWLTVTGIATIYLVPSTLAAMAIVTALVALTLRGTGTSMKAIALRGTSLRFVAAAMLIGCCAWYVDLRVVMWLDPPQIGQRQLQESIERMPLALTWIGFGLAPAIGEELLFRGVLARVLAARLGAIVAVIGSALVFGAYHIQPGQIISNTLLGAMLAVLALRAGSIAPAMIAHLCNNTFAIVIARDEVPPLGAWISQHPNAVLAGSSLAVACGLALCVKGAPA